MASFQDCRAEIDGWHSCCPRQTELKSNWNLSLEKVVNFAKGRKPARNPNLVTPAHLCHERVETEQLRLRKSGHRRFWKPNSFLERTSLARLQLLSNVDDHPRQWFCRRRVRQEPPAASRDVHVFGEPGAVGPAGGHRRLTDSHLRNPSGLEGQPVASDILQLLWHSQRMCFYLPSDSSEYGAFSGDLASFLLRAVNVPLVLARYLPGLVLRHRYRSLLPRRLHAPKPLPPRDQSVPDIWRDSVRCVVRLPIGVNCLRKRFNFPHRTEAHSPDADGTPRRRAPRVGETTRQGTQNGADASLHFQFLLRLLVPVLRSQHVLPLLPRVSSLPTWHQPTRGLREVDALLQQRCQPNRVRIPG